MTTQVAETFLEQLLSTPAGRQHMLSISVDAEEGDEQGVFDQLAALVDDPDLHHLVVRHRDDEVRHAQLFRGCLERAGLEKQDLPEALAIIRAVAADVAPAEGPVPVVDVAERYALLFAIEERGVEQFPLIAQAIRPHDPETADVYLQVARDERRHVGYCTRIGRRYSADEDAWRRAVERARQVESDALIAVGLATVAHCAALGWVDPI